MMSTKAPDRIDENSPWPGLFPYVEEAARFFNGRSREAQELLRLVRRERLSVLFGQSGLGKSSLIQAGLFPRLRPEAVLPVMVRLDFSAPSSAIREQVWRALRQALDDSGIDARRPEPSQSLWEYFHDASLEFWDDRNRQAVPLLVFDQFEEMFTIGQARSQPDGGAEFLTEFGDLVTSRIPEAVRKRLDSDPETASAYRFDGDQFRVLITFREDFLADFEELFRSLRIPATSRMRLTPMGEDQALEAVQQTGGHLVDESVAQEIVAFVSGRRQGGRRGRVEVEPALLSVVCRELNLRRQSIGADRISSKLLSGASEQIIENFYERSIAGTDTRLRDFIEDELLTDTGYRDAAALDDALRLPGITLEGVRTLIEQRVLRLDERFGIQRVELTHDILAPVVQRQRDRRRERQRAEAARQFEARRRKRTRRWIWAGGLAFSATAGLASVFGVLYTQAEDRACEAIASIGSNQLSRATADLNQGVVSRETYRSLVDAVDRAWNTDSAAARAVSLMAQRRYGDLQWALPWSREGTSYLGSVGNGSFALSYEGTVLLLKWQADPGNSLAPSLALDCLRSSRDGDESPALVKVGDLRMTRSVGAITGWAHSPQDWLALVGKAMQECKAPPKGSGAHPPKQHRVGLSVPDTTVAFADSEGRVWLEGFDGSLRKEFTVGPEWTPRSVSISPSGRYAALATIDGKAAVVSLTQPEREKLMLKADPGAAVAHMEFTSDAKRLIVQWSKPDAVDLWAVDSGRRLARFDGATKTYLSGSGRWLATVSPSGVTFAKTSDGAFSAKMTHLPKLADSSAGAIGDRVNDVAFDEEAWTPDGWTPESGLDPPPVALVSPQDRSAVLAVSPASGQGLPYSLKHEGVVVEAQVAKGLGVVTSAFDGTVRVWKGSRPMQEPLLHPGPVLWARSLLPDADSPVLTFAEDGQLRLWRLGAKSPGRQETSQSLSAKLSEDGRLLARVSEDGSVAVATVRRPPIGDPLDDFRVLSPGGALPLALSLSPNGKWAVWAESAKTIAWRDTSSEGPVQRVTLPRELWLASSDEAEGPLAISSSGHLLAAETSDGSVRVYDARTGRAAGIPIPMKRPGGQWRMTGDGRYVLVSATRSIRSHDARTGYQMAFHDTGGHAALHFSEAKPWAVYSNGRRVIVWKSDASFRASELSGALMNGEQLSFGWQSPSSRYAEVSALVSQVRWSRDAERVLAVTVDGRVGVMDSDMTRPVGPYLTHDQAVESARFSSDGRWVITSTPQAVRVWDARTSHQVIDPVSNPGRRASHGLAGGGDWLTSILPAEENRVKVMWQPVGLGFPLPLPAWFTERLQSMALGEFGSQAAAACRARRPLSTNLGLNNYSGADPSTAGASDTTFEWWNTWRQELASRYGQPGK